jgi:hemolysin III
LVTTGTLAAPPDPPYLKPRMRGWLHFWSFAGSLAACATLIAVSASMVGGPAAAAASVYSVTILGLFGVSALYHRRTWRTARGRAVMKRLDHSMIFLFIAGTYTPFALLAVDQPTGFWVLAGVWAGALAGVALKLTWPTAPRWVGVPLYIGLGWVAVFVLTDILHIAGVASLVLLATGGVLYTLGGVAYAVKKPNPVPGVFGYHEVFHAMTIVAAICHYIAVYFAMYNSPFV